MKILYGINGTGNGHLTKSLQIISELEKKGYEVDILISGMKQNINIQKNIEYRKGVTFVYNDGKIDFIKTIMSFSPKQLIRDLQFNLPKYDKIITDFEPLTAWSAKLKKIETIGISHQYSFVSQNIPRPKNKSYVSDYFIRNFAPVTHRLGLHFNRYDEFIYQPIIRKDITNCSSQNLEHITVYLPSYNNDTISNVFSKWDRKFEVFTDIKKAYYHKNIHFMPLSLSDFTNSLVTCDTLITAGGFETPSEALYLGKKLIIVPIIGHWEQLCNAEALQRMGVRVEKKLTTLKSLSVNKVDWIWNNPIDEIIEFVSQ